MMTRQKIGVILALLLTQTLFGQSSTEKSNLSFLTKPFRTFKQDLHIIRKCFFSKTCSPQETRDAKKALLRLTVEAAALTALIYGTYKVIGHFKGKPILNKINPLLQGNKNKFFEEKIMKETPVTRIEPDGTKVEHIWQTKLVGPDPVTTTQLIQDILGTTDVMVTITSV